MMDVTAGPTSSAGELRPARWFHLVGGERRGPVGLDEMRELVLEGSLGPQSWVWADGMDDWMHVHDVPALTPPRALRVTLTAWPYEPDEPDEPHELHELHEPDAGPGRAGPDSLAD
jgi:hypothetical protein